MRRSVLICTVLAATVLLASKASSQIAVIGQPGTIVGSVELIANSVPNLTEVDIYTVPAPPTRFKITDVIIGNPNATANCCARIFTGPGASVQRTGFITVPANGSIVHGFLNAINFNGGQVVNVRNGASSGDLHFTIRGYLFTVP